MRISDWSSDVCSSDLTEQGAGPIDQLPGRERLRHVVVGTQIEALAALELAALARQHHDPDTVEPPAGAVRLVDGVAIAPRQHDVEPHQVRQVALHYLLGRGAAGRNLNVSAFQFPQQDQTYDSIPHIDTATDKDKQ